LRTPLQSYTHRIDSDTPCCPNTLNHHNSHLRVCVKCNAMQARSLSAKETTKANPTRAPEIRNSFWLGHRLIGRSLLFRPVAFVRSLFQRSGPRPGARRQDSLLFRRTGPGPRSRVRRAPFGRIGTLSRSRTRVRSRPWPAHTRHDVLQMSGMRQAPKWLTNSTRECSFSAETFGHLSHNISKTRRNSIH